MHQGEAEAAYNFETAPNSLDGLCERPPEIPQNSRYLILCMFFLVNRICINDSGAFQETAWTTNCPNNSGGLLENSHIRGLSIWIPAKQLPQNSFSSDTSPLFAPWGHLSFLQWRLLQRVRVLEEGPKDVLRFKLQMTQWISDKLLQWALSPHSSLAWPFTSPPFHRTPVLFFWWRLDVHLCFFS